MVSFLETALQQAGENRVELEKVLSHYKTDPADSLKYKAACFLIENMPYYTYYKGKQLDRYLTYYTLLQETRGLGISPQVVADSVCHMYGALYLDSLQSYRDIELLILLIYVIILNGHLRCGRNNHGGNMFRLQIFVNIFFLIVLVTRP